MWSENNPADIDAVITFLENDLQKIDIGEITYEEDGSLSKEEKKEVEIASILSNLRVLDQLKRGAELAKRSNSTPTENSVFYVSRNIDLQLVLKLLLFFEKVSLVIPYISLTQKNIELETDRDITSYIWAPHNNVIQDSLLSLNEKGLVEFVSPTDDTFINKLSKDFGIFIQERQYDMGSIEKDDYFNERFEFDIHSFECESFARKFNKILIADWSEKDTQREILRNAVRENKKCIYRLEGKQETMEFISNFIVLSILSSISYTKILTIKNIIDYRKSEGRISFLKIISKYFNKLLKQKHKVGLEEIASEVALNIVSELKENYTENNKDTFKPKYLMDMDINNLSNLMFKGNN